MDKLSAMATFVAVVDTGSFTRAAESLDLPKARVSQRISDLEAALGTPAIKNMLPIQPGLHKMAAHGLGACAVQGLQQVV